MSESFSDIKDFDDAATQQVGIAEEEVVEQQVDDNFVSQSSSEAEEEVSLEHVEDNFSTQQYSGMESSEDYLMQETEDSVTTEGQSNFLNDETISEHNESLEYVVKDSDNFENQDTSTLLIGEDIGELIANEVEQQEHTEQTNILKEESAPTEYANDSDQIPAGNDNDHNAAYEIETEKFVPSPSEEFLQEEDNAALLETNEEVSEQNEEIFNTDEAQHQEEVVEENQDNSHDENFEEIYYENPGNEEIIQQDHEEIEVPASAGNDYELNSEVVEEASQETDDVSQQDEIQENYLPSPSEEIEGDNDVSSKKMEYEDDDDDNDYEDAVEVEENKQMDDEEDENVAQHESGSDNDQEEIVEDSKLDQMNDYDVSDSDAEEAADNHSKDEDKPTQEAASKMFESDSEDDEKKEGDLIADIFGKSDDEDEEFTGFGEEEDAASSMKKSLAAVISDSDEDDEPDDVPKQKHVDKDESSSDEGIQVSSKSSETVYDFDIMLQKKKDERRGRRKRDGGTFISDADDIINAMLTKMKEAAEADRDANKLKKPALCKLKMLSTVVRHLKKQDLKEAFVDMGVIPAIADWLSLLPDKSLPHITIRSELLDILHDLPPLIPETLKSSGIGRAVMMLFKHPKETRKNKDSAGRLINKWTRPIFGLNDNFKSMSRGEREQRDLEQMPQAKRRRLSSGRSASERGEEGMAEPGQLRPGERGFVMRARVPKPSNKDYVIRPKWNIGMDDEEGSSTMHKRSKSKKDGRLEKHLRNFAERKKSSKMQRAVGISLEGNKMPLS